MKPKIYKSLIMLGLLTSGFTAFAQAPSEENTNSMLNLDLEQLMNIQIVSASKKSESIFDAPLSASVLTRDEIKKAGCTSLMEAFKLMPGLIVREQTNGNYDIHLRGMDNIPPMSTFAFSYNTTTLVMIDNRPVFNYYQGGTFWETLPVDLNDIEKIEIVRGPSAAMYGPNAVSGVINIITRNIEKDGIYTIANAQYGTNNSLISNASVGFKAKNGFDFILSGNTQQRDRSQLSYYDVTSDSYVAHSDSLRTFWGMKPSSRVPYYPKPEKAMSRIGANAFINYRTNNGLKINLQTGLQESNVQKVYYEGDTAPITGSFSKTSYTNVNAFYKNLTANVSYNGGMQQMEIGNPSSRYDFNIVDALIEYNIEINNLSIKPGLNYRRANYNDLAYADIVSKKGIFNGSNSVIDQAAFIRSEYKLMDNRLRLVAALRADKFNAPDKTYFSYQFAPNFKINENNLLRAVYSRSNRSPFIVDTYVDLIVVRMPIMRGPGQIVPGHWMEIHVNGNDGLDLLTTDMFELGNRVKLADNLQLDVELFHSMTKNYASGINGASYVQIKGPADTVVVSPINYMVLPLKTTQTGVTISLNYVYNKLQVKPFATIQETTLKNYSAFPYLPESAPSFPPTNGNLGRPDINNMNSGLGTTQTHKNTPAVFGGAYINYHASSKWNLNFNPYFLSKQTFVHRTYSNFNDDIRGVDHIQAKLMFNARVSYKPIKQLDVFVSGRNILGKDSREFFRADRVGPSYFAGLNFEL